MPFRPALFLPENLIIMRLAEITEAMSVGIPVRMETESTAGGEASGVSDGFGQRARVSSFRLVLMVAAVGAAYFLSNFHRLSLGVMGSVVARDFALSPERLGTLGSALFYTYGIMQFVCGTVADRWQARTLFVVSCLATGAGTLWFSRAESFAGLAGSRCLTGAAVACVYVPALAYFRRWFGDRSFGTVTGVLIAMGQLGTVSASTPLKWAADVMGWRETFAALGCVSLFLAAAAFFCVPKTPLQKKAPAGRRWAILLRPAFWAVTVWFCIAGGTRIAFHALWGADFFVQALGKGADRAGLFLMWQSIGCIFGAILLGWVSDVLGSIRTLALSGIVLAAAWAGLSVCGPATPDWVISSLNLLLGVVGVGGIAVAFSCVRLFSEGADTGFLTGVNNCFVSLGSAVVTQGIGYFMHSAPRPADEKYFLLFSLFAALCLLSTLTAAWANRKI
jgi:sugar phosphate permease